MIKQGDNLKGERNVTHAVQFKNIEGIKAFLQQMKSDGFELQSKGQKEDGILLIFEKKHKISPKDLHQVTYPLLLLTEKYNASYVGWETEVKSK